MNGVSVERKAASLPRARHAVAVRAVCGKGIERCWGTVYAAYRYRRNGQGRPPDARQADRHSCRSKNAIMSFICPTAPSFRERRKTTVYAGLVAYTRFAKRCAITYPLSSRATNIVLRQEGRACRGSSAAESAQKYRLRAGRLGNSVPEKHPAVMAGVAHTTRRPHASAGEMPRPRRARVHGGEVRR